jgi:hypothetical protein
MRPCILYDHLYGEDSWSCVGQFFGGVSRCTSTQVKIMIVSVCRSGEAKEAMLVLETQIDITQLNFILPVFHVIE